MSQRVSTITHPAEHGIALLIRGFKSAPSCSGRARACAVKPASGPRLSGARILMVSHHAGRIPVDLRHVTDLSIMRPGQLGLLPPHRAQGRRLFERGLWPRAFVKVRGFTPESMLVCVGYSRFR